MREKKYMRHVDLMSNEDIIGKASTMILMGKTLDPHQKKKKTQARNFGPKQKKNDQRKIFWTYAKIPREINLKIYI